MMLNTYSVCNTIIFLSICHTLVLNTYSVCNTIIFQSICHTLIHFIIVTSLYITVYIASQYSLPLAIQYSLPVHIQYSWPYYSVQSTCSYSVAYPYLPSSAPLHLMMMFKVEIMSHDFPVNHCCSIPWCSWWRWCPMKMFIMEMMSHDDVHGADNVKWSCSW